MLNNKTKIFVLFLVFLIVVLLGAIYYFNSSISNKNNPSKTVTLDTGLTGYDPVKAKISALLSSKDMSPVIAERIVKQVSFLENKNSKESERYQALISVNLLFNGLYSDTNDSQFREISKDLGTLAKDNFPKSYDSKEFETACQDSSCAQSPQPKEILKIIDDIKNSDMSDDIKQGSVQNLLNPGFLPDNLRLAKVQNYSIELDNLQGNPEFSPSGQTVKIANELYAYLKKTYPTEFAQVLKDKEDALKRAQQ